MFFVLFANVWGFAGLFQNVAQEKIISKPLQSNPVAISLVFSITSKPSRIADTFITLSIQNNLSIYYWFTEIEV